MSNRDMQKIVIFEEMNACFFSLACDYVNKGGMVCYFRIDQKLLNKPIVQKHVRNKVFFDISTVIFDYILLMKAGVCAHKNIDAVFTKFFGKSASVMINKRLFQSPDIENIYKKEILLYLNDLYFIEYKINDFIKDHTGNIIFYPLEGFEIHSDETAPLSKKVIVARYSNFQVYLHRYQNQLNNYFQVIFHPLYFFLKTVKWVSVRNNPKKKYRLGINVNLPAMCSWNYHYLYYLVDEQYGFPKEEILFIDKGHQKRIPGEFETCGFTCHNFLPQRFVISWDLLKRFFRYFFPAYFLCLIRSLGEDWHIVKTTRTILADYVRWNIVMDSIEIKNHVTILHPERISKNLILRGNNCKTWYIYPDNYTGDYHTGYNEKIPMSTEYLFNTADIAIVYGNKVMRFFSYNRNSHGKIIPVGVLSAQRIHEYRDGQIHSSIPSLMKQKNISGKIISVFDSGFVDWGPNKAADGIRFAEELLLILEEMPEISIIFKQKRFFSYTPHLTESYAKLENHPRCLFIKKQLENSTFATEVIAYSDLVISVAYTSTTAEALAAGIKAIYYDVAGNDQGDTYYFNNYPNMVAHTYDELKALILYWLYTVSDEEFKTYLKTYVMGEIDPYLDMKAIDRLQDLLQNG